MLEIERFRGVWERLGARGPVEELYDRLIRAWSETHRAYHTTRHLSYCLEEFDGVRELLEEPDVVEIALWFHDAVYDPDSGKNEEESAEWASAALLEGGLERAVADRVYNLIMATRHTEGPADDKDMNYLLDMDIAILGAPEERFDEYEKNVRIEYRAVPEALYREKRAEVLASFLEHEYIYATGLYREKYEAAARRNIENSIKKLSGK